MPTADLDGAQPPTEGHSSHAVRASPFTLTSQHAFETSCQLVSRCTYCEAFHAGSVDEVAAWFRIHRAACAKAPDLVETDTMKARARNSLLKRARAEKIQASRDRKESLRRTARELLELGSDTATIAATWNREAVRSLAPSGIPWSANSVASLVGSSARMRTPVRLDQM